MDQRSEIARPRLFERLARGHAEPVVVLTPNQRLAQALEAEFDRFQLAAGHAAWEAPAIKSFDAWMEDTYEGASYTAEGAELPGLLPGMAEQLLWEDAVAASPWRTRVLSVPATAALAARAWRLAHDWGLAAVLDVWPGNEDSEAFAAWRTHYRRRTEREHLVDAARLPALVATLLGERRIVPPAAIVLYAFDVTTVAHADFAAACARAGIEVLSCAAPHRRGTVARVELDSPRQELELAARWARSRLEANAPAPEPVESPKATGRGKKSKTQAAGQADLFAEPATDPANQATANPKPGPDPANQATATPGSGPSIAIVVPDLQKRRAEVVRIFSRVLGPQGFNVSLAPPLAAAPLVDAALAVLELSAGPMAFDRASRLLRSPFIDGAESEMAVRARLDVALRRNAPATVSLGKLRGLVASEASRRPGLACPRLVAALGRLFEAAQQGSHASPHDWGRRFTERLQAMGFPGERTLDSAEFQTLAKWRELLSTLATLGSVAPAWSAHEARACLQRLATETTFQPASGSAPVQVLGLLESAGLAFDHLWVSGLTDDAWPIAANPQPLIPVGLQRKAGIPQATPQRSLAVDAALTAAWREAAGEVVFSSAHAEGDRELLVSALVRDVARVDVAALGVPEYPTRREALFAAGRVRGAMVGRVDQLAPALAGPARGGTSILVDQAACPFRAFAHFRLGAKELERPEPGLGPPERGMLLHEMMAKLWRELKDQATLNATEPAALEAMIASAAAHAVDRVRDRHPGPLEGRFAELERERLAAVAREWLAIERRRAPFEVVKVEEPMDLAAGNLQIKGRIDRMDRILDGGGLAVIDYKTGANASTAMWLGDPPDDCQLPLYALAADAADVRAVAFAKLKVGKLGFAGISRDPGLLPEVTTVDRQRTKVRIASWDALMAGWREQTARLGGDFAASAARVEPKEMLATCKRCDLQPLCRVHERVGTLDEGDDEE
jgi:probable DNA repair protein